uniref:negative elongation factor E isoform X2 n=1 Tax=Myxine glutinosa TaxID=7769 RepID=UPI00358F4B67
MLISCPLTEEEEVLQKKFARLKKKKKAAVALKKQNAVNANAQTGIKRSLSDQPIVDSATATEQAKRLVKSGAISAIKVENKSSGFKRSRMLEGKLKDPEKEKAPTFQPFQRVVSSEDDASESASRKPQMKNLYDSFVSASGQSQGDGPGEKLQDVDTESERKWQRDHDPPFRSFSYSERREPRRGNTIYVFGRGITTEILQSTFSTFGNILNITLERGKNTGFVTFDRTEAADQAIREMNWTTVKGIELKVSMARRQPRIDSVTTGSPWSSLAASHNVKGSHRDRRTQVVYDNEDIFS